MITNRLALLICLLAVASLATARADDHLPATLKVQNAVHATASGKVGGVLGQRLDDWRRVRLGRVANDPFLLEGFAHRPGQHPWQGEHVGKRLPAATLA